MAGGREARSILVKDLVVFLCVIVVIVLTFSVILMNIKVPTSSMEGTLPEGCMAIASRLAYMGETAPARGDIIVFRAHEGSEKVMVKRIVGTPGDTVEIRAGTTFINGTELAEPYLKAIPERKDFGPFEVPEGSYLVMGDNRNNSRDSRYWEDPYVKEDDILAKMLFLYWPLSRIGGVE